MNATCILVRHRLIQFSFLKGKKKKKNKKTIIEFKLYKQNQFFGLDKRITKKR